MGLHAVKKGTVTPNVTTIFKKSLEAAALSTKI